MRNGQTAAVAARPARHPDDAIPYAPRDPVPHATHPTGSLGHAANRAQEICERARGIADELRQLETSLVGVRPERPSKDGNAGLPIAAECYAGRLGGDLQGIDCALTEILSCVGRIREEL